MKDRIITLCYRKIVDVRSERGWEKLLFEATYKELKMQFQLFDQQKKFYIFSELLHATPAAQQLHFLVSASVQGYIKQLANKIPDVKNSLGKSFIPFNNFGFEIIESDIRDRTAHAVAINFVSDPLVWLDTIGSSLLLSRPDSMNEQVIKTELVTMQSFLSIYSLQKATV